MSTARTRRRRERKGQGLCLADLAVDVGDYDAERLYLRAPDLSPEDAGLIEAIARYDRIHGGTACGERGVSCVSSALRIPHRSPAQEMHSIYTCTECNIMPYEEAGARMAVGKCGSRK
jgi:hypothetical protein